VTRQRPADPRAGLVGVTNAASVDRTNANIDVESCVRDARRTRRASPPTYPPPGVFREHPPRPSSLLPSRDARRPRRDGGVRRQVLSVGADGSYADLWTDDASGRQRWRFRRSADGESYNILVDDGVVHRPLDVRLRRSAASACGTPDEYSFDSSGVVRDGGRGAREGQLVAHAIRILHYQLKYCLMSNESCGGRRIGSQIDSRGLHARDQQLAREIEFCRAKNEPQRHRGHREGTQRVIGGPVGDRPHGLEPIDLNQRCSHFLMVHLS
jgi:hypothetical protein